jgi:type III pantothenate kinase
VLDDAVRRRFDVLTEYITSSRRACGVTNSYRDTWRLGADRWVSSIGAYSLAGGRAGVIANAGTALTIDAVNAGGRHRGGAIIPGPKVMVESLLSGTHGIRRRAQGGDASVRSMFATDTASALAAGSQFAAAAFIDRAVAEAAQAFRSRPVLFLTGGAAPALERHLATRAREVPDLVLRGLAVFAKA